MESSRRRQDAQPARDRWVDHVKLKGGIFSPFGSFYLGFNVEQELPNTRLVL